MGRNLQLLIEKALYNEPFLIKEKKTDFIIDEKNGEMYIEGPYALYNKKNLNRRYYSKDVMEEAIENYNDRLFHGRRAVSELGHPENSDVNIHLIAHKLVDPLYLKDNIVYGRSKVLKQFERGKILYDYLKEGLSIGISSRGVGEVESKEIETDNNIIEEVDYITLLSLSAFDAVWEPSIGQFVNVKIEEKLSNKEKQQMIEESLNNKNINSNYLAYNLLKILNG